MMQVTVNAREREVDDWAELFKEADEAGEESNVVY